MNIQEQYQAWKQTKGMPQELLEQLESMKENEISDSFYQELAFGTGGLRGVLGAGTNRMNFYTVWKATRGLGRYILEQDSTPACAVSFDSRIHSEDFAHLAAATLAEMGINVWIYPRLMPTPMLSFAVRHLRCTAGIMITASHNPSKFNGYKVYGSDGCQITSEAADKIQALINAQPVLCDCLPCFDAQLATGRIHLIENETLESFYREVLKLQIHPCDTPLHVVYSPLYGTGNEPVREILRRLGNIQVDIVEEQEKPNGHFPTCPYPNPEIREAMQLAIEKTLETGADFCFATDPDCDRMGAGVRTGNEVQLISGNDMGVLLLDYICKNLKPAALPPVAIKTIVTTEMAAAVCKKYGVELRNVLTGFKYIGEQIALLEKDGHPERYLFGFEESYGYLSGTHVRDKDAVNASMLLCEMAANLKAEGKTLLDQLNTLRAEYGFFAQRLLTFTYEGEDGAKTMANIMDALRKPLKDFAYTELQTAVRTDYLLDDTGLPRSNVLAFAFQNGFKVVVRPSGTEPKLKIYLFAQDESQPKAEAHLDGMEQMMTALCKA